MPVINTRKRKPSAAAIEKLLAASSQQTTSRRSSRTTHPRSLRSTAPENEASDLSDTGSAYSGDVPLRRMRATGRRRVVEPRAMDEDDDEIDAAAAALSSHAKRRRMRSDSDASDAYNDDDDGLDAVDNSTLVEHIARMRALLRRAERAVGSGGQGEDDGSSASLHEEIRRLHATVEAMAGHVPASGSMTPLETLQTVHSTVRGIQSMLAEPISADELARLTRPILELLWQQARQAADFEMRSKLTFWRQKAQHLRGSLQAVLPSSTKDDMTTAVRDALGFVSSFYLVETAPNLSRDADPAKDIAVASANAKMAQQVHKVQLERLRETCLGQPLASSLLLLSQTPRPTGWEASSSLSGPHDAGLSGPPDEQAIGRGWSVAIASTGTTSNVASMSSPAPAENTATGIAAGQSNSSAAPLSTDLSETQQTSLDQSISRITTKGLNMAARRRLATLVSSQLRAQASQPASSAPPVPISTMHATTASTATSPWMPTTTVVPESSHRSVMESVPSPSVRSAPQSVTATAASQSMRRVAEAEAPAIQPVDNEENSDSDLSHSGVGCATCGRNDAYSSLLLCDNGCEREFHTFCLQPPLDKIPEGDWYCPKCLAMEKIQPDSQVYSCSAALCSKITGGKYCTLHRCKFDKCLNRSNFGGFCRRHEQYREPKAPRKGSNTNNSVGKPRTVAAPLFTPAVPSPTPSAAPPATAAQPTTSKARLNAEQLMSSMRQMGIWLPAHLTTNVSKMDSTSSQ